VSVKCLWSTVTVMLAAACGEKTVEVTMVLPSPSVASQYDTSCVKAMQLYLNGATYPGDPDDYVLDCQELDAPASTFEGVHDGISGKFDLKLPASGLSGVEAYAFSGPCDAPEPQDYDLVFYGSAAYIGQDPIELPVTPNLSCTPSTVTLRPVDILKLSATKQCAQAAWTTGNLGLSTLSPLPFTDESFWWGGLSSTPVSGGTVTITAPTLVAPKSCLAVALYTTDWMEVTCVPPQDQRACATGNEIEAPMIHVDVGFNSISAGKLSQYGGIIYGVVYGAQPIANAKVEIDAADADRGQVVYFDMPAGVENGTGVLTEVNGATGTNATGLFGIYTQSLIHVTITANGQSVKRVFGANEDELSAVIVKL
jgi:hypothetical protein